ncbi:hypothetical protein TcasGA2_TC030962 [Tribolium castaneum]|uniref:Uncharacterized protein n=1 Tax=Tribolium castaneum TaxID=7070 RepID=A0A139WA98_TRICA|nr:hypothetical protein TcasGA2_TC030962 [Tribolium castaneum]
MKCQIRGLNNLEFSIEIENVGTAIQAEKHYHKSRQALGLGKITFDQYLRHAEINAYLAQLAKDYPDTVTLETIGQSYEKHSPTTIRSILTASPLSRQLIPFIVRFIKFSVILLLKNLL